MRILLTLLLVTFFSSVMAESLSYVGREQCVQCHAEQDALWQGSHHDLAMQHADADTVLGDFTGATFEYAGISSKFYKKGDGFYVRTDGPDGRLHEYAIKYTFGVTPLQQYLIELDGGRLQALSIAWDSRAKSEGGQRWFHLYPDESIRHEDELHWTRNVFNWNGMCAECHSTNLQKNYDASKDTFDTSWSEIDVSCEACHGPASAHLSWANKNKAGEAGSDDKGFSFRFDERENVLWKMNAKTGNAIRSEPRATVKEIEVCAQCHSRRSVISSDYSAGKPFLDHYMPRLLDEGMYHADGQIQDEVYVYGSFMQSKMQHMGVTCSDCHEPHSLELRQPGNGVCLQCHSAEKFDTKKHHFHDEGTSGASCAECHMPPTAYMVVDPRHDHSMRIPRPDLSVSLDVPNACNQCHTDKDASWSAKHVKQWYRKFPVGHQRFAEALDAGRKQDNRAGKLLAEQIRNLETPGIARASAISIITPYLDQANFDVVQSGLKDEDVLVRVASLQALEGLPQELLVRSAFPLLDDPVMAVRIEAARVLAVVPVGQLKGDQLVIYTRAADEYIESQQVNADRPQAQLNLGNYYLAKQDVHKAESAYRRAIKLESAFTPAYVNLADLYRALGKEGESEALLRKAIETVPDDASVHYALALLLVRKQETDGAISMLTKAVELDADNVRYIYVYAVALNSAGKVKQALDVLHKAHLRYPSNTDILTALVTFNRDAGNDFAAQRYMKKLEKLR